MDKLTAIKIKKSDGSYSNQILISALAENVRYDGTRNVKDILDLLNARISTIASLEVGSTTGDAELMDLRVGANGKSNYTSAGQAVRSNINKLQELILIQETTPGATSSDGTTSWNKLWINNGAAEEIEIPTKDEFDILLNTLTPVNVLTWQSGDFDVNGANHTNSKSIRSTNFIPDNIIGVMCSPSYKFCVWAWDKETGDHVGHLKEDGTFGQTSSYKYVTSFALDKTLGYKYKVTFYNENSTTNIATSAGVNCITYRDATDTTLSLEGVAADAAAVGNVIAPVYSAASAYNVGDYVNYNGTVYRCKTAIGSGGEAWTIGHWEATSISNEFKNVDQDVTNLKSALNGVENVTDSRLTLKWEKGGIDNTNGTTNNEGSTSRSRDITYYKVKDLVSVTNGSSAVLWCIFYKYSNNTYSFVSSVSVAAGAKYAFSGDSYYVRFDIRSGLDGASNAFATAKYEIVKDIELLNNIISESTKNIIFSHIPKRTLNSTGQTITTVDNLQLNIAPIIQGHNYSMISGESNASGNFYVYAFFVNEPLNDTVSSYNNTRYITTNPVFEAPITGFVALRSVLNYNAQIEEGTVPTEYMPHRTAKDYIAREEVSALTDSVSIISESTRNLIYKIISGRTINASGQTITTTGGFKLNIAPIEQGNSYIMTSGESTNNGNFYIYGFFENEPTDDVNVAYDNTVHNVTNPVFEAPITGFVAMRSAVDYNAQIEVGVVPTEYTPHRTAVDYVARKAISADADKQNAIETFKNKTEILSTSRFVEDSIESLLKMQSQTSVSREVTIDAGTHDRVLVRIGLHYGSSKYTPEDEDIFFDGNCKTDFSDVRFFDVDGKMLKAEFGPATNFDLLADTRIDGRTTLGGKIIKYSNTYGIMVSVDNGDTFSAISGTANVTVHPSDVYGYTSMYPVYSDADDNIYAYAGGKLYKLLNSDNYATKTEVCDFTWTSSGTTIYPEIQNHGMDTDVNGVMYFGIYQGTQYFHVDVYKSIDNGLTWSLCYTKNNDQAYQHVHHVHSDKYTGKTYIGIDSVASSSLGSKIIVTDDGGSTWSDITEQIMESDKPAFMKDYYPTYFGDGYRLGGGETYIGGRATIYRSTDDTNLVSAVKGIAGVRSFADFGDDDVIICGSSQCNNVSENHIFVSYDHGQTWHSIYKKYQTPRDVSGLGFRDSYSAVQLNGDTEPCIVVASGYGNVPPIRIYAGGDNYYREAYIELENTSGDVTITAKSGYALEYPYKNIEKRSEENLVYHIPLSEGNGRYVHDSAGNICEITGNNFTWDTTPVTRFGDYSGESTIYPYMPSYGIRLLQGTTINFGKISALNFSKNYSIAMWIRTDGEFSSGFYRLLSVGNTCVYQRSVNFGIIDNEGVIVGSDITNALHSSQMVNGSFRKANDDYYFLVLTVDGDNVCKTYLNGSAGTERNDLFPTGKVFYDLNSRDMILGSDVNNGAFYMSDIRFYNKVLTATEVLDMYRGWRK